MWRVKKDDKLDPGHSLYIPGHEKLIVADWWKNKVVVLNSGTGSQIHEVSLPDRLREVRGLCLFDDQIIVKSKGCISYVSLQ